MLRILNWMGPAEWHRMQSLCRIPWESSDQLQDLFRIASSYMDSIHGQHRI